MITVACFRSLLFLGLLLLPLLCCAAPHSPPAGRAHTLTGNIQALLHFHSRVLNRDRDILVYLPPDYETNPRARYPVLYMHDGQNLFDGATSFIPGQEWQADETAQALIEAKTIAPLLIVGIYNAGDKRLAEYTPTKDKDRQGGEADAYGRMLVEELKPFIDKTYRTHRDAAHTGLGGSSLGGLVSLYLSLKYPHTFGKVAVVSPSVWWDDRFLIRYVEHLSAQPALRIWLDMGTHEGPKDYWPRTLDDVRKLRDALLAAGWTAGQDLQYTEVEGAEHNEVAWAARFGEMLKFLYPPTRR